MKIDKQNGDVAFAEKEHVYWNVKNNRKYISVTTLIGKFEQPYDSEFWSKYKALERLIGANKFSLEKSRLLKTKKFNPELLYTYDLDESAFKEMQDQVKAEWAETNRQSCERGTKFHSIMEHKFYSGAQSYSLQNFGIGGKFKCKKDYLPLDLDRGVYPEYLVSYEDDDISLAGQIDLLIKDGNDIIVGDYKTNRSLDKKSYYDIGTKKNVMMKYPLNNLMDCNFMHYTMQLSTYAWILTKMNPKFTIKRLFILHFDHNGNTSIHEIEYRKDEVERMIKEYKKIIKREEREARRKPIDF